MNKLNTSLFLGVTIGIMVILFLLSGENLYFTRLIVLSGTLIVALISFSSFLFAYKSSNDKNPHKFVRGIMGATMIKFFLCLIAVALMLFSLKKSLHKPDLYVLMLVYLIYTILEAFILSSVSRKNKA